MRLFAAVAALLVLAGCSRPSQATGYPVVDRQDALAVMSVAVATMFTWHPAREASTADAFRRAVPYFTDEYAAQAFSVRGAGGEQWKTWARQGAVVVARAEVLSDEHPADHPASRQRVLAINQEIRGGDGGRIIALTAWVTAVRVSDGWRVSRVEL